MAFSHRTNDEESSCDASRSQDVEDGVGGAWPRSIVERKGG
jgi:hypothetical protein